MLLLFNSVLFAVVIGSLVELVLGQGASAIPQCGTSCLQSSLIISTCAPTNQTCLCLDDLYNEVVETCVLETCTVKEQLTVKNATQTACGAPIRNKGTEMYTIAATLGTLTAVIVVLRLAFRKFVTRVALGSDDWCILATLITGLPGTIIVCEGTVPNGIGKDVWTLTFQQITDFGLFFFATEIQYFITLATLKLTLLLFYLRIFPSERLRYLLWATVIFDVLFAAAFTVTAFIQCMPMSYFWTMWDQEHQGRCVNINAIGWANAIISIILDVWMLALPLSQLKNLRLHWKQKIGVALMFFVGTFVTVVSALRLQALVTFASSTNPTFDNFDIQYWSTIELNVGIMCACMPAMRQMLAWVFPVVFSGTRSGGSAANSTQRRRRFNVPRSTYFQGSGDGGSALQRELSKRSYRETGITGTDITRPMSGDSMNTMVPLQSMASGKTGLETPEPHPGNIKVFKSFYVDEEVSLEENWSVKRRQF